MFGNYQSQMAQGACTNVSGTIPGAVEVTLALQVTGVYAEPLRLE